MHIRNEYFAKLTRSINMWVPMLTVIDTHIEVTVQLVEVWTDD